MQQANPAAIILARIIKISAQSTSLYSHSHLAARLARPHALNLAHLFYPDFQACGPMASSHYSDFRDWNNYLAGHEIYPMLPSSG